jgi:hypothetical protein
MYKIIAPNKVTEKAWGLNFIEGIAESEDEYLSNKLKKKGYEVTLLEDEQKEGYEVTLLEDEQKEDPENENPEKDSTPEQGEEKKSAKQKKAE